MPRYFIKFEDENGADLGRLPVHCTTDAPTATLSKIVRDGLKDSDYEICDACGEFHHEQNLADVRVIVRQTNLVYQLCESCSEGMERYSIHLEAIRKTREERTRRQQPGDSQCHPEK